MANYDILINNIDVIRDGIEQYKNTGLDLNQLKTLIGEIQKVLSNHIQKIDGLLKSGKNTPSPPPTPVPESPKEKKGDIFSEPIKPPPKPDELDENFNKIREKIRYFFNNTEEVLKYIKLESTRSSEGASAKIKEISDNDIELYYILGDFIDKNKAVIATMDDNKKIDFLKLYVRAYNKKRDKNFDDNFEAFIESIKENPRLFQETIKDLNTNSIKILVLSLYKKYKIGKLKEEYKKLGLSEEDITKRELEERFKDEIISKLVEMFKRIDIVYESQHNKPKRNYYLYKTEPPIELKIDYEKAEKILPNNTDTLDIMEVKYVKLVEYVFDALVTKYNSNKFIGDENRCDDNKTKGIIPKVFRDIRDKMMTNMLAIYNLTKEPSGVEELKENKIKLVCPNN